MIAALVCCVAIGLIGVVIGFCWGYNTRHKEINAWRHRKP